ncbi:hypothetical protein C1646_775608 [Rhizophagus diaphanus]|nr:hypothetical protein C1646_775608 [Rhizophagus diaphanus] [Rhizophagus sp. MUCL 43196]
MNFSTAANILHSIFDFLSKDNIMFSEVINYGVQFGNTNILPNINNDFINEKWNEDNQDYKAIKLLPERYEDYICIKSSSDGNYFFNSTSLIVFRNENFNLQLQLATIIELMTHALFYLQQSIFEQDIIYRNEVFDNKNIIINDCGFKKESEYISELKLMCKPHSWNSMIAFFGLASVLYRSVESLFSNTNSKYMNQIYNHIILPRENKDNLLQCIIMWSSYSAEQFKFSYQFVPVFKKLSPPLQNNFIDFTAFSDDKLSYIQDYLSITEDCNKLIIVDYNITKLVIIEQLY